MSRETSPEESSAASTLTTGTTAGSGTGLLRSTSISNLFSRKRAHTIDSEDNGQQNQSDSQNDNGENSSESEEESAEVLKKRKIESEAQREFQRMEKVYTEELPEEYRKFRPTGYRFNLPPADRPIRVYADGVFDLFHLGHMRQLEQAKKALPNSILIVGIPSDVETHKRKGLTVLSDYQRCETLKHCKWVDEVIPDSPWCVTPEFLTKHKIDYVAHDDLPYASADSDDIYRPIKEAGMFLTTQRTEGISTSDIITKIIRDYDKYLMRNFARGATRQELNVSWFKKNELEFKKHISDFRSYWKKTNENLNNVSKDLYFEVREYLLKKSFIKIENSQNNDNSRSNSNINNNNNNNNESNPAADFAKIYTGDSNLNSSKYNLEKSPSFIENFKEWMYKTDNESNSKSSSDNEKENETLTESQNAKKN